jgi:hypothetical protein
LSAEQNVELTLSFFKNIILMYLLKKTEESEANEKLKIMNQAP